MSRPFLKAWRWSRLDVADRAAIIISVVSLIAWIFVIGYKYIRLQYHDWDLALFTQATWNLLHGSQFVSLTGVNFFGDHSQFVALIILPVFWILPHPLTLVMLKIISYLAGSLVLYHLAKKVIGGTPALICMLVYITFPANIFAMLFEFSYESFAPVFLFLMYKFFKEDKFNCFFMTALLTMLIKENMPLIVVMFGVYAAFVKKERRWLWSVVPIIAGLCIFFLMTSIVIPHFRGVSDTHPYVARYRHLGVANLSELFLLILQKPVAILKVILAPAKIQFLLELFGPLLLLAVFSPQFIFLTTPLLLQHLLSNDAAEHTIYYHYGGSIAPFIFLAVVHTLSYLRLKWPPRWCRSILVLLILFSVIHVIQFKWIYINQIVGTDKRRDREWQWIERVPPAASVIATFDYLPPLSLRKDLYSFHAVYDEFYQNREKIKLNVLYSGELFKVPENIEYALIDFNDQWLEDRLKRHNQFILPRIHDFFSERPWQVVEAYGDIVLFQRRDQPVEPIVNVEIDDLPDAPAVVAKFEDKIMLAEVNIGQRERDDLLPMTFKWATNSDISERYFIILSIERGKDIILERHYLGYLVHPTPLWRRNQLIKERYWMPLGVKLSGSHDLRIQLYRKLEGAPPASHEFISETILKLNL